MRFMRTTKMMPAFLLAVAGAMLNARPVTGQELFEWPDTAVDISTYKTVEECSAAVGRVRSQIKVREYHATHIDRDTIPDDLGSAKSPLPSAVVETVRACLNAASAHVDTVGVDAWDLLAPLYLIIGMDDSARAVVERRLAEVELDNTEDLKRAVTDVLLLYGKNSPVPPKIEVGDEIILAFLDKIPDFRNRFAVYMQLIVTGSDDPAMYDEMAARARRHLARFMAEYDEAAGRELEDMSNETGRVGATSEELLAQLEAMFTFLFGKEQLRDSLRVSTAAYAKVMRETWGRASDVPPEAYMDGQPLGERAPVLEGDIWLGCEGDPCEQYPRAGRVSLVWFYTPHLREIYDNIRITNCSDYTYLLRRLSNRFPELDIVVVAQTVGRYHYVKEGMTPEREAQLIRKCLDSVGLDRAVLTMTESPGWRLPEPDGRWVDQPTANWTNYSFDGRWSGKFRNTDNALLIDQDGYIVHVGRGTIGGGGGLERNFAELIEILLEREKAKT